MRNRNKLIYLIVPVLILVPLVAMAQGALDPLPSECIDKGNCGLEDIALFLSFFIRVLLGAIGGAALLYFIWGGIQWLISAGNSERVKRGQQIMVNTAMALAITFGSYLLVEFFVNDILATKYSRDTRYQISSECVGKSRGAPCYESGLNYVCTGDGVGGLYKDACITRCQLMDLEDPENTWQCVYKEGWMIEGISYETNLCPGGVDYICAKNVEIGRRLD